jgi:predicted  nucleic acid-binding Zn-ribbon protein
MSEEIRQLYEGISQEIQELKQENISQEISQELRQEIGQEFQELRQKVQDVDDRVFHLVQQLYHWVFGYN